jgi:UDP-N-acetylmuramate dehydrogenase
MIPLWAQPFESAIRWQESLSRHNTWHVGGVAECYFEPQSREQLQSFLSVLPLDWPAHWLGLGSNVLIRDGGLRGAVISTLKLNQLQKLDPHTVLAEAGVPCARLAKECVAWNIGPAAFWVGIPGTVGGALALNAGAWEGETWTQVSQVELIDRQGKITLKPASAFSAGYRQVAGLEANQWFLSATFRMEPQAVSESTRMRELLEERRQRQPIGAWSGGSTFKNPRPEFAARLIEAAGLKGYRLGGAVVSDKHANFILNEGEASAADIESLIEAIIKKVESVSGIRLAPEVRIMGDHA